MYPNAIGFAKTGFNMDMQTNLSTANGCLETVEDMDIERRMKFTRLTDDDLAVVKDFAPHLEDVIDDILSDFYENIMTVPDMVALFKDEATLVHAKQKQRDHWMAHIFSGTINREFVEGTMAVGRTHARIGLAPRWYIGSYSFVLNQITAHATLIYADDPERMRAVIQTLTKLVFLDMDIALSVYFREGQQVAQSILNQKAAQFEDSVKSVAETVLSASVELEATSEAMAKAVEETKHQGARAYVAAFESSKNTDKTIGSLNRAGEFLGTAMKIAASSKSSVLDLDKRAQEIGSFVETIKRIAEQTNLLALNAAIEAARAGHAGKGFAVVADEVKALSGQTAKATDEISRLTRSIQENTQNTTEQMNAAGEAIAKLNEYAQEITADLDGQSVLIEEVRQTANVVEQAADEGASAATQTTVAAAELTRQANNLQSRFNSFLAEIQSLEQ